MNKQLRLREDNTETDLELIDNEMLCTNDGDSVPVKSKRVTYEKYKKQKKNRTVQGHKKVCLEIISSYQILIFISELCNALNTSSIPLRHSTLSVTFLAFFKISAERILPVFYNQKL